MIIKKLFAIIDEFEKISHIKDKNIFGLLVKKKVSSFISDVNYLINNKELYGNTN